MVEDNTAFNESWIRWTMHTARSWDDVTEIIKETKLDKIDADHRALTEFTIEFNTLLALIEKDGFNLEFIQLQGELFNRLLSFAQEHFAREEAIITKYKLPYLEYQQQQHKIFLEMIQSYIREFESGKLNISLNLKLSILEWWINHINHVDYNTFCLSSWSSEIFDAAGSWDDLKEIIRMMGVKELDLQHQQMTELALQLSQIVQKEQQALEGESLNKTLEILASLEDFARKHFDFEEMLMTKYQLTGNESQTEQHQYFLSMIDGFRQDFLDGKTVLLNDIKKEIVSWWVNHINTEDYNTFCAEDWRSRVLRNATDLEDLTYLLNSTGIDQLDQQHIKQTEYILLINNLVEEVENFDVGEQVKPEKQKELQDQIQAMLNQVYDYAREHFKDEEKLMKQMQIKTRQQHIKEHERVLSLIREQIDHILSGRQLFSRSLKSSLLGLWFHHINHVDYQTFQTAQDSD